MISAMDAAVRLRMGEHRSLFDFCRTRLFLLIEQPVRQPADQFADLIGHSTTRRITHIAAPPTSLAVCCRRSGRIPVMTR
jgi:hypothetical protein